MNRFILILSAALKTGTQNISLDKLEHPRIVAHYQAKKRCFLGNSEFYLLFCG
jgi:hypothetical protein